MSGSTLTVKYSPDLHVPAAVVLRPDAEDVFTTANTHDSATHLFTSLGELVANEGKKKVFPVSISDAFLETHDPFASSLVLFVFPNRPDALLEEVPIRHNR